MKRQIVVRMPIQRIIGRINRGRIVKCYFFRDCKVDEIIDCKGYDVGVLATATVTI